MNEKIVNQLFELFKEQYGSTVADPVSVLEGQQDLLAFVMGIGQDLERCFFEALGTGYQGTKLEREGLSYRFKGNRKRQVHGLFGKITLKRAYYVAGEGRTHSPLDSQLSIRGHTPGLQYFLTLFTGQMVYERALEQFHRIFRPEGRDQLSMRKALDMDYELGQGLQDLREQEIQQVYREDKPVTKVQPIEGVMAVCVDATKIREKLGNKRTRGSRRRYEIGFKDAKVASFSGVQWDPRRREASCVSSSYVAAEEEADEFFQRIWVEMQRRGVDPEKQPLVFVADGAEWIWNRVRDLRNDNSVEILDFYHAAEHLSDTCKQLYGEQTPRFHEKYRRWLKAVYRGKASEVIVELKGILNATRVVAKRRILRNQIDYLKANLQRMNYPRYRRRKLPIGSGTVESACKNVIGSRMKLGGMTWSPRGADGMLHIRSSLESGRFDSDFRALLAA